LLQCCRQIFGEGAVCAAKQLERLETRSLREGCLPCKSGSAEQKLTGGAPEVIGMSATVLTEELKCTMNAS
jgi:hypothetical protein